MPRRKRHDTPSRPRVVMTVKELAEYLHVSTRTIYHLVNAGKIPAFKVGDEWRFNIESINAWRLRQG
jgi:excisionase family DNA binding protein